MDLIPATAKTAIGKGFRSNKLVILATIGLIFGISLGYFLFSQKAEAPSDNIPTSTSTKPLSQKANLVVDQQMPGEVVLVKYIEVASSSWVVVHEDKDGQPGNILGALFLRQPGVYTDEQVPLLRNIEEDKIYYVIVHNDNGDGFFDYKTDLPRKDKRGNLTKTTFEVIVVGSRGD